MAAILLNMIFFSHFNLPVRIEKQVELTVSQVSTWILHVPFYQSIDALRFQDESSVPRFQ